MAKATLTGAYQNPPKAQGAAESNKNLDVCALDNLQAPQQPVDLQVLPLQPSLFSSSREEFTPADPSVTESVFTGVETSLANQTSEEAAFEQHSNYQPGRIEVYTGCMFSGKTSNLVDRIRLEQSNGYKVQVFHPTRDTRTGPTSITSHNNKMIESQSVVSAEDLLSLIEVETDFVAIDEVQFFDHNIVNVCMDLTQQGKHLLLAGLDLDFKGLPFGPMPQLLACASLIHKYRARCRYPTCQEYAVFSQRLVDGRPASYYEKVVVVGGEELYEPRCASHHIVPNRPNEIDPSIGYELDWHLLEWARELKVIAKNGLNMHNYEQNDNVYDAERYGKVEEVASKISAMIGRFNSSNKLGEHEQFILPDFKESGYITPKVAVATAAFNQQNKVLLVKRSDTQCWALPGGWAEVGRTPLGNAIEELRQETGVLARCDNLIAVYDERLNKVGRSLDHIYTLLFHCTVLEENEEEQPFGLHRQEVLDAGFFSINELAHLNLRDGAATQVINAFEFHIAPRPAYIDQKA